MSFDSIPSGSTLTLNGDLNSGNGMFGQVSSVISGISPIFHTPPTHFSKYYNTYLVDISAAASTNFDLAIIGTNVIIGHKLTIKAINSAINTNVLIIRNSALATIATLRGGFSVNLTARSAPGTWIVDYDIPSQNSSGQIVVYNTNYPTIDTFASSLPIRKEMYFNGSNQLGVKCLETFDSTEPLNFIFPSTYTNLNRINFVGNTNLQLTSAVGPGTPPVGDFQITSIGTRNCIMDLQQGGPCTVGIYSSTGCSSTQTEYVENASIHSCNTTEIRNNAATITEVSRNIFIASSESGLIRSGGLNTAKNLSVLSSQSPFMVTSKNAGLYDTKVSSISGSIGNSAISCDTVSITSNSSDVLNPDGSNNNELAYITVLSSYNIALGVGSSINDIRYCVIGGYNGNITWSIDSKSGIHYGSGFNNTQPLPGISEMYENLTTVEIPLGRLVTFQNGKLRLCNNNETGKMISRPLEGAAFLGGNTQEWPGKYVRDIFGRIQYEMISINQILSEIDNDINLPQEIKNERKKDIENLTEMKRPKLNPSYDPNIIYTPRINRPTEWTVCEKMGRVVIEHDGSLTTAGQYVISAANGIGKVAITSNIMVLRVIDSQYAEVDLIPSNN